MTMNASAGAVELDPLAIDAILKDTPHQHAHLSSRGTYTEALDKSK